MRRTLLLAVQVMRIAVGAFLAAGALPATLAADALAEGVMLFSPQEQDEDGHVVRSRMADFDVSKVEALARTDKRVNLSLFANVKVELSVARSNGCQAAL